ncbi:MAG: hypothetical protein DRG09_07055, partial [Epsilonproteobacteria bacterium]
KNNILKSLLAIATVFVMTGCGGSSSPVDDVPITLGDPIDGSVEETVSSDVPTTVTLGTETINPETQAIIDAPASNISQELINTLSYMGNEERLAYDVYNALYDKYGKKTFTNIATKGEYQHITLMQELIQKYKLSDDVNFTNVDLPALGYMNTAIEDMVPGVYDVSAIQGLYDDLMDIATNEIEALKVGCKIEVIDIMDLDHDIALAEAEDAADIIEVFKILRAGSYNHYWAFDGALQSEGGCCPTALEILGGSTCPDYPQK